MNFSIKSASKPTFTNISSSSILINGQIQPNNEVGSSGGLCRFNFARGENKTGILVLKIQNAKKISNPAIKQIVN
jgi:hypothetical protein